MAGIENLVTSENSARLLNVINKAIGIDNGQQARVDERFKSWNLILQQEGALLAGKEYSWQQIGRSELIALQVPVLRPRLHLPSKKNIALAGTAAALATAILTTAIDRLSSPNHSITSPSSPITYVKPHVEQSAGQSGVDSQAIAEPATEQVEPTALEKAFGAWKKWRAYAPGHLLFYGPDSDKPLEPPFDDPKHPAAVIDSITRLAVENNINPGIVLALIDTQRDENEPNGFAYKTLENNSKRERRGFGLLTKEEFNTAVSLKMEEDIALGRVPADIDKQVYASWHAWGDETIDENTNIYGIDDIRAVMYLLKNGVSFTSFRESAPIIYDLHKQSHGHAARTDLGFGYRASYDLTLQDGRDVDLLYATLTELDAQAKAQAQAIIAKPVQTNIKLISAESSPNKDAVMPLLQKYFGPMGVDIEFASHVVDKESTYRPNAVNGKWIGLMQIDGGLHQDTIKRLYGYYDPEMLKDPDINIRVAAELYKDSKKLTGNGWLPWGFAINIVVGANGWKSRKIINIPNGRGWTPPEVVLASLDYRRKDYEGKLRLDPRSAAITQHISLEMQRIKNEAQIFKESSIRLGRQTVSNRKLFEMVKGFDAQWHAQVLPSEMIALIEKVAKTITDKDQRALFIKYCRGLMPNKNEMQEVNTMLDAVTKEQIEQTIMENYRAPEEIVKARKEGRKVAMKTMKKRAEEIFGRKVNWYSLKKDEMLQVALNLTEDHSLDSFTSLIPASELTTNNRTNRRLKDTWARHADFANILEEGAKTRASLIMKEMLKTQTRSKAAIESHLRRKRIAQAEDSMQESIEKYLHDQKNVSTAEEISTWETEEEYEKPTIRLENKVYFGQIVIFNAKNNQEDSLFQDTLPALPLYQLLDRIKDFEHWVENGVLVMHNTAPLRVIADEFARHDGFEVEMGRNFIRVIPPEVAAMSK